ncbi:hypothetical protein N836_03970 [Leptolyngbya sp. Heron Island J]|nr:hypothetical protein N836_03970 [Leptolyngbya sp. Heron Island J]
MLHQPSVGMLAKSFEVSQTRQGLLRVFVLPHNRPSSDLAQMQLAFRVTFWLSANDITFNEGKFTGCLCTSTSSHTRP